MLLITEESNDVKILTENEGDKKYYFIEGIFMQSEIKNKNGRKYPKPLLEREVARYNRDYISQNRAFGELNHPAGPAINLDRVSHIITELYADGTNYYGKAKILDTNCGMTVQKLLEGGAQLAVSTRGAGTLRMQNGFQVVQDDYKLSTAADIVSDPSGPDCFVRGIMEGAEWIYEDGIWSQASLENAKKTIQKVSRKDFEATALRLFETFMKQVSNR